MTQHRWVHDELLASVLCCPCCRHWSLHSSTAGLLCQECHWQSDLIGGDTANFAPIVYEGARNRTVKGNEDGLLHAHQQSRLRRIHQQLVPWRRWIYRDTTYWRSAIEPLRQRELGVVRNLLAESGMQRKPGGVLLELGVGFQDHLAFYREIADYAICSDIYRDPMAVQIYGAVPWAFYCLINVERLPIREATIDFLFTSHVVEHFPDRVQNLKALHRVLKPDALACHVVPIASGFAVGHVIGTIANAITFTPRLGRGIHGEYDSWWQEIRQTTVRAWLRLFEECGFEVLSSAPGTLGLTPLRPSATLWLSDHLHIYGSWVFLMRAIK